MSKRERPLIERYWREVGGTIVFEFCMVQRSATCSQRHLDALIFPKKETRIAKASEVSIEGEEIILVQAKDGRLGMYLMGQVVFSLELMKKYKPASIRSIALCVKDDATLRPLLDRYPEVEVVIVRRQD